MNPLVQAAALAFSIVTMVAVAAVQDAPATKSPMEQATA